MKSKIITVFGSSQIRSGDVEYVRVFETGKLLAEAGFVVCNGGYAGAMEASARGAKEAGGKTIGVTTREFKKSHCNPWIDEEKIAKSWRERLFQLIELGQGYLVCSGGTGTLVELSCVWEMARKSLMAVKPIVILGRTWRKIVSSLNQLPEIGKDDCLLFAKSPREAVEIFRRRLQP